MTLIGQSIAMPYLCSLEFQSQKSPRNGVGRKGSAEATAQAMQKIGVEPAAQKSESYIKHDYDPGKPDRRKKPATQKIYEFRWNSSGHSDQACWESCTNVACIISGRDEKAENATQISVNMYELLTTIVKWLSMGLWKRQNRNCQGFSIRTQLQV